MKNLKYVILVLGLLFGASLTAFSQSIKTDLVQSKEVGPVRSSPAYAEAILRKTELQADLESMLPDYTEENPKVIDVRFEIGVLTKDIDRLFGVRPTETGKLTEALGKLIVRRAAIATELHRLLRTYSKDHPEVKRAQRRVDIYDAAIREILG